MSMNRTCPNCFQKENIRVNFGGNREAEREFHSQKWCNCDYNSPDEMMIDQDMGFTDPNWIRVAKYFIKDYHLRISQGHIKTSEELVRFFLKLLKSSANNIRKSIELIDEKDDEEYGFIYEGKTKNRPKTNIFKTTLYHNVSIPESKEHFMKTTKSSYLRMFILVSIGIVMGLIVGKLF